MSMLLLFSLTQKCNSFLSGDLREDFSFTPYTTYFYMKLGRKAPLLKSQTHTLSMKMRAAQLEASVVSIQLEKKHVLLYGVLDVESNKTTVISLGGVDV